jgi:tetratricopeptide (TPR) repeat protein
MAQDENAKMSRRVYEVKNETYRKELELELREIETQLRTTKFKMFLYIEKAMKELMLGMAEKTIESAKQALLIDETSLLGWYILGCGYFDTGRYSHAKASYEKALTMEIDPKCDLPYDRIIKDIMSNIRFLSAISLNKETK